MKSILNYFDTESQIIERQINSTTTTIRTVIPVGGLYISKINTLADETALRSSLITKDPRICQGKPIIRGTRISVSNIVELYYLLGWDVQKIIDAYPHLSDQQIMAAIEYYESHKAEIDSYLREEVEINEPERIA